MEGKEFVCVCVMIPYLGMELTQDYPATERKGKEENRSTEDELHQLRKSQSQCASQSLRERENLLLRAIFCSYVNTH